MAAKVVEETGWSLNGACFITFVSSECIPDAVGCMTRYRLSPSVFGVVAVTLARGGIHENTNDRRANRASPPGILRYTSSSILRRGICCFCATAFSTYTSWSNFLSITDSCKQTIYIDLHLAHNYNARKSTCDICWSRRRTCCSTLYKRAPIVIGFTLPARSIPAR